MKTLNKGAIVLLRLLGLSSTLRGGQITVTTTQPSTYWTSNETVTLSNGTSTNITITNQCVPISKHDATILGVTFTTTYTYGSGSVTQLLWTFANSETPTSNLKNPTAVFLTNAYGLANPCSVGVTHIDTNGLVCATDTASKLTIPVNVIQPLLQMKTSGAWSSGDTAYTNEENSHGGIPMFIGVKYEYQTYEYPRGGTTYIGCPYEYTYTILSPVNSGAFSKNMTIYETVHAVKEYYQGTNLFNSTNYDSPVGGGNTYNPGTWYNYTTVSAPTNPAMYASDAPGFSEGDIQDYMVSNNCTEFVGTITLTSYPLYYDYYNAIDSNTLAYHTFVFICVPSSTNASDYSWTASANF